MYSRSDNFACGGEDVGTETLVTNGSCKVRFYFSWFSTRKSCTICEMGLNENKFASEEHIIS